MDVETYSQMEMAIEVLNAQELLAQMRVEDFPHQKPENRRATHKELYKQAFPKVFTQKKSITWEEMGRMLSG